MKRQNAIYPAQAHFGVERRRGKGQKGSSQQSAEQRSCSIKFKMSITYVCDNELMIKVFTKKIDNWEAFGRFSQ